MTEADSRIIIDKLLRESEWILPGDQGRINVKTEKTNKSGRADYVLFDSSNFPLCIIEAKNESTTPLNGKEKAREYAQSLKCRFILLSNGFKHYFWDIEQGNPTIINSFYSQEQLELWKASFNPPRNESEEIDNFYIAKSQIPNFLQNPDYINETKREGFLKKNKLRILRDYQLGAVKAVQKDIREGKDRFLLEMATGTGKTLTSSAIIKMFLRLYEVKRVLFLVDRIELETQAQREFDEVLKNDFNTVIWKENKSDWERAEIVISTVQSFVNRNKYRKVFRSNDFDLVISDEAHRSLGARSRKVFEYFIGFKLGLTATPRDYLKSVDIEEIEINNPKQLEKRLMLDTYTIFGCDSGEPTFRYSLEDGVKDGYLLNPKVIDARTEITTQLLSEEGYILQTTDEDGNDCEESFKQKDFEKKFFSENTNTIFAETFIKNALKDPYTGEIGKTLIFCVSQKHASKVTQILNILADRFFPKIYNSDFAVQVTSDITNSQEMTVNFRNNSLNGQSKNNPYYRTSKTRVCVTVGMMTTGYDCTDILNICMMRPVYSPSEFIQMKGRGTRICNFSEYWISKSEIPDDTDASKKQFLLFDFFGNYEYFEKEFDYDEVIKLPSKPSNGPGPTPPPPPIEEIISTIPDPLAEIKEILISNRGMKIDRDLYPSFKRKVTENELMRELVQRKNFNEAEKYLYEKVIDKADEYFSLEKLRKSLGIDRKISMKEILLHAFDHIQHIPSQRECLDEEFDKLDKALKPDDSIYAIAKEVFEAYAIDEEFREIIESKRYAELGVHPSGEAFKTLPIELKQGIPNYIKENVDLERLANVG